MAEVVAAAWKARARVRVAGLRARLPRPGVAGALALAVSLLGLVLRVHHAATFDGPVRGSDYDVYVQGVRWMLDHGRPFNFDLSVPYQVRYQPPLWFALGALVLKVTHAERAIAGLAVGGWVVRQLLLARILKEAAPGRRWSALAALSLNALLPLSVLIDGKVNPEGAHATLFMVATYLLFRLERQASAVAGVSRWTAALFGLVAGLAVLTKGTSSVLMLAAALVLGVRAARSLSREGLSSAWRRLLGPSLLGALVFCVVAGWWCVPNLKRYGHPFPHEWYLDSPRKDLASVPVLYRRPLGWALPFELGYLSVPLVCSPVEPRSNFWGVVIAGTWADAYNRGFCRLQGGGTTDRAWGCDRCANGGGRGGASWLVSGRCLRVFVALVRVGAGLSLVSFLALLHTAWTSLRTGFLRGSLALPAVAVLGVFFVLLFAMTYPFDYSAVMNPRYLLPVATPMAACLGLWLGHLEGARRWAGKLALVVTLGAIGVVGALLVLERFGR